MILEAEVTCHLIHAAFGECKVAAKQKTKV